MDPTFQAVLAVLPAPYAAYVAAALSIASAACVVASIIDASFPQPAAGSFWVPIRKVIAFMALSKGFATNAVTAGAVPASLQAKVDQVQAAAVGVAQAAGELEAKVATATAPIAKTLGVVVAMAGLALSMSACTAAQVTTSLNDVRLFCQTKDAVVALSTVAGTPVLAQGQTASYVNAACALAGGVAVSPPASPSAAPVVAIPAVSVPL